MNVAKMKSRWFSRWLLAARYSPILICCLVAGCISPSDEHYDLAKGPHDVIYHSGLSTLPAPSIESIKKASAGNWRFNQPEDQVWKACLEVVSQDHGIVSMGKSDEGRTLCIIVGRSAQISPSDEATETTFCSYYDLFLAIAVYPESGQTAIGLAALDPDTGALRPLPSTEQLLFAQIQTQLISANNWAEKFADVDWQKLPLRPGIIAQATKPQATPQDFEIVLGDWIGKRLRIELGVVNCPKVTQSLNIVAQRLKNAAGIPTGDSGVQVLASSTINAFALPNGEIYVTAGLLDSAQSIDEVAAVLAHEVDHLKHRDVAEKLRIQANGIASAHALRFMWGLAQIGMSVIPAGGLGTAIGEDIGTAAANAGVENSSSYLEGGMVENFSTDVELRADEDGCKALYAAGFDAGADLTFLVGMKDKQSNPQSQKSVAASNFVNVKPGLDERIAKMRKIIAEFGVIGTAPK